MKTLTYSIKINKPQDFVFSKITDKSVYPDWAKAWGRFEQPHRDDGLCPWPARLVALAGMIEGALTADDLLARLGVDRIVERQHQPSGDQGGWDRLPQRLSDTVLWRPHRGHDGVVTPLLDTHPEQRLDSAPKIRRARDRDRHQDRYERQQELRTAFLPVLGERKKELEFACAGG